MALNKIAYQEINNSMKTIDALTEDADKTLKNINTLIEENVGEGGRAWSGASAAAFRNSWTNIANNFNSFVQDFRLQSTNIQTLIREAQAVDTAEAGNVNQ